MATEIELKARTLIWEDSESNFESENHVFKKGEEVVILNPLRRKIGDGSSVFNSLPFDTNHYHQKIGEAAVINLYNVIPQTTFFYKRSLIEINDITFRLDSFKDSNRTFFQCDGRMHKIFVQNTLATTMDVELSLSTDETTDNSIIHDIGTVTLAGNSIAVIEFTWFKNSTDKKICFCRIISESAAPPSSTSTIWQYYSGASRVSDTTINVPSMPSTFAKGAVVAWRESGNFKVGMVATTSGTVITIVGAVCTSIDADSFKLYLLPVEMFKFVVAGTIGAQGTTVGNRHYANFDYVAIAADLQLETAGTTNSTVVDINHNGSSMFTTKPSLATTVKTSPTPFSANQNIGISAGAELTLDIDNVQVNPGVGLYVQLYVFQARLINIL